MGDTDCLSRRWAEYSYWYRYHKLYDRLNVDVKIYTPKNKILSKTP